MGIEIKKGSLINGRYEIIQLVGRGGMADVYKAKCNKLNRFVAIKFLKEEFLRDREFIERFDAEAKASAGLTHPNIVSVYDVGEAGARKYIVMEFVEGITLKEYIERNGKLAWREATSVAGQICSALACAHRGGIIHRDIKPHNIILTKTGVAKVTDFGIARAVSQSTIIKSDRSILGSAHYFSPEQGVGGSVDKTTDLYSLGVVLFEMLTGRVPFDNQNPISLALMHSNSPVPDIGAFAPDVPGDLKLIVYRAMGKKKEERYQSAESMLADLKSVIKGGSVAPVTEPEEDEPDEDDIKKSKRMTVIAVAVIVVVLGIIISLAVMFVSSWGKSGKDKDEAAAEPTPTASAAPDENGDADEVSVPNVLNYKKTSAVSELEKAGYDVKVEEEPTSDKSEDGMVIKMKPAAGTVLPKDSEVTIYVGVYSESEEIEVSQVIGKTEKEAKEILSENFKVVVEEEETDSASKSGTVIKQNPLKGKLQKGKTVVITVGKLKSDSEITVVKVVGQTKEKAKSMLGDDFEIVVEEKETEDKSKVGVVLEQKPAGGEKLKEGGTVTIVVGKEHSGRDEVVSITVPETDADEIWVEVRVDGTAVMKQTYDAGQTANCIVKVKPGEKKKVEFYVNGKLVSTKEVSY